MDQWTARHTEFRILLPACLALLGAARISGSGNQLPESVMACVPCHSNGISNQVGEWIASPYSFKQGGLVCGDCHQTRCSGVDERRPPGTSPSNLGNFTGLTVNASRQGQSVDAEVVVTNLGVGHLLPSGAVPRSLVLEVTARNRFGSLLTLSSGPSLGPASGRENPSAGRVFSAGSQISRPPHRDTRLAPFASDVSGYRFVATDDGPVEVVVRLVMIPAEGRSVEIAKLSVVCTSRDDDLGPR